MTRTAAREIAIQLCFAAASADLEPRELAGAFLTPHIMRRWRRNRSFSASCRMRNRRTISCA